MFDDRVSDYVGSEKTHTTIGECIYSDKKTDNCENCRYSPCNARIIADPEEYKNHFGFCSQECADKALENGYVRSCDFDRVNYKKERQKAKDIPHKSDEIYETIRNHIQKHTEKTKYNHQTSQKEEFVID